MEVTRERAALLEGGGHDDGEGDDDGGPFDFTDSPDDGSDDEGGDEGDGEGDDLLPWLRH